MDNSEKVMEQLILFSSVLKWLLLATITGVLVGISTAVFLKLLGIGIIIMSSNVYYFILLPFAFVISSLLVLRFAPEAEGHGTEKVIEAIHERSGKIFPMTVPVKLVATIITLASGGSAGKEGPCAQIGAGIASLFSDILSFSDQDRKKLVICGISAGFASVFGTPLAGALFGIEVLFAGSLFYPALLPSLIAGIVGYYTTLSLGITYPNYSNLIQYKFDASFFPLVILAGLFFGICSFLLIEVLEAGTRLSKSLKIPKVVGAFAGGVSLTVFAFLFSTQYLGLGLDTISTAIHGTAVPADAFILKIIATTITLNFGGSGGIVTPIFFIGSTSGSLFATLLHLDISTFSAMGLVSLLAGATNAPIAASIMSIELFGAAFAPYATIACIISFFIAGHRSVYPSQKLAISKSSSIIVEGRIDNSHIKISRNDTVPNIMKKIRELFGY